jgi:hypothetical protein
MTSKACYVRKLQRKAWTIQMAGCAEHITEIWCLLQDVRVLICEFNSAYFDISKVYTVLLELFMSNVIQDSWIFGQELPCAIYGIILIATEADMQDVGAYDMEGLMYCHY